MKTIHTTESSLAHRDVASANTIGMQVNSSPHGAIPHMGFWYCSVWRAIIVLAFVCHCFCLLSGEVMATGAAFTVNNTATVLEVSIPANVYLDLSPTNGVKFNTQSLSVLVGTNNATGYTLTMQASSDTLTRTSSITDSNNVVSTPTILPMLTTGSATGYTAAQFEDSSTDDYTLNRWGYKLSSDTNFMPMDTSSHVIASTNAPGNATATTLNFAAKVDTSVPSGTYATTISFTAVTNEVPIYMQDTASIAMALPNKGDSIYAYDARDGKKYKLAKLEDGKIWMVENLNLAGGNKLYSETSDVPLGFPESAGTGYYQLPASATQNDGNANLTDNTQFSNNSTAYVFNSGNNTTTCNGTTPCNSYYSWLAATAGGKDSSGNAVTGNGYNAAYSICPKGWRLPTSTTSNANAQLSDNWKTGDLYALATAYGADLESNYFVNSNTFYNNAGPNTTIPKFLLAGYYDNGSFNIGGIGGNYMSATSYSSTGAYSLYFLSGGVNSADYNYRRRGFSVRCLTKTLRTITVSYGANVTSVSVNGATVNNGGTIKLSEGDTYTIAATYTNGYGAINWSTTNGIIAGPTSATATYTVGDSNATLSITASKLYMQNTEAVLAAVPNVGDETIAYDNRDGKQYWIARLADGHVWMTQNLDLCIGCAGTSNLTSENTDLNQYGANNYDSANGYSCSNETVDCSGGVITWSPERATIAKDYLDNETWQDDKINPYSYRYGDAVVDGTDSYEGHKYVGTYYNYSAAIASNNSAVFNGGTLDNISGNPKNSVCPKGWRLPTISSDPGAEAGSTNEFRRLNVLYNNNSTDDATNLMNAPLYFTRSGAVYGGSVRSSANDAYYRSSTASGPHFAYTMFFRSVEVHPEYYYNYALGRGSGLSVRCIVK